MSVDDLLPSNLPMLVSRSKARTLLRDAIADGKALLLKRTPSDLNEDIPRARALKSALRAWGTKTADAMATCFGAEGATAIKSIFLSYTTLEKAKQKVRLRLKILQAALEHANQSQKVRSTPLPPKTAAKIPRTTKKGRNNPSTDTLPAKLRRKYDFCLSFAGEDRKHAERLTKLLEREDARVFYDYAEKHNLWGKDLYAHLQDVYQNQSRYCVMFTSKFYVQKAWPNLERGAAQARSLVQPEYILPIKLDDTPVPGLLVTKGVMDVRQETLDEIAQVAMRKLREEHPRLKHLSVSPQKKTKVPNEGSRARSQRPRSSLVMLEEDFYRSLRYRESGDVITITIWPRNDAEELRLRNLAQTAYGPAISFAHRRDSGRGHVQGVEYVEEQGRDQVVITLHREALYRSTMTMSHDSTDRLERQVRWVLLGESLPHHERYSLTNSDSVLTGRLNANVLKGLWEGWKHTKAEFLEAAQLLLTFLLKDLGILDNITDVKVGPWKKQKLPLHLKGTRKDAFSTSDLKIDVSDELEFPAKPRQR